MATVANFALIPDGNPNIPLAGGDSFIKEFSLPSLAEGSALLLFRYKATEGRPTLKIRINNNERVSMTLVANGDASCSFHETILSGQLTELSNHVVASATGNGKVVISDLWVVYPMTV